MKKIRKILSIFLLLAAVISTNFASVYIQPITVEAASSVLNKNKVTLSKGQKVKLKSRKKVSKWISNNSRVASVSKNGTVTAKRNGKAKVTAIVRKKKYTCNITVKNIRIKKTKISGKTSIQTGKSTSLRITVTPSNASNKKIKWTSSNSRIATVSSKGVVTGKRAGTARIYASTTDGGKLKVSLKINVTKVSSSSTFKPTSKPITKPITPSSNNNVTGTAVRALAPKADECVLHAFEYLKFEIERKYDAGYTGYFSVKDRKIYLRQLNDTTIYHELGHFLAWISGSRDTTAEFKTIFNNEKNLMTAVNKPYCTQNSSEYYAESYREYCLDPKHLEKERPKTYKAIHDSVVCLNSISDSKLQNIKELYAQVAWNND